MSRLERCHEPKRGLVMGLALFKERRISERRKLTGLLPGRLRNLAIDSDVDCKLIDVSEHGIGVIMDKDVNHETQFALVLKDQTIPMTIQWSKPDFGKSDSFRFGLVCNDPSIDLVAIFSAAGCLE